MIIKTPEFAKKFNRDLSWIVINKNRPLKFKGSYILKNYGDIITDIDIDCMVKFNNKLLNILVNIINKTQNPQNPFTFLQLNLGYYKEFRFPWIIDNRGGCQYNLDKTREWYENLKKNNLLPLEVINSLHKQLFEDKLNLKILLGIEKQLYSYSKIIWNVNDILRGYKIFKGTSYFLLDELKNENFILEYLYKYNNNYVSVDFALRDKDIKIDSIKKVMNSFYTQDLYQILKKFKWKLKDNDRIEFVGTLKKFELLIALIYQVNIIFKIQMHQFTRKLKDQRIMNSIISQIYQNLLENLKYINSNISWKILEINSIFKILNQKLNHELENIIPYYLNKLMIKQHIRIIYSLINC